MVRKGFKIGDRYQISTYVLPEIYEQVRTLAERNGRSVSDTAEWLIAGGLLLERMLQVTGAMAVIKRAVRTQEWLKDWVEAWRHGAVKPRDQYDMWR